MHKYVVAFLSLHDGEMKMKHYMVDSIEEAFIQCLAENSFDMKYLLKEHPSLNEAEALKTLAFNSDCYIVAYRVS